LKTPYVERTPFGYTTMQSNQLTVSNGDEDRSLTQPNSSAWEKQT